MRSASCLSSAASRLKSGRERSKASKGAAPAPQRGAAGPPSPPPPCGLAGWGRWRAARLVPSCRPSCDWASMAGGRVPSCIAIWRAAVGGCLRRLPTRCAHTLCVKAAADASRLSAFPADIPRAPQQPTGQSGSITTYRLQGLRGGAALQQRVPQGRLCQEHPH